MDFSRPHSALLSPSSLASRDVSFSFAANCRRSDAEAAEAEATSDAPSPIPSPPTSSLASRRANASAALACPRSAAFAYSRRARARLFERRRRIVERAEVMHRVGAAAIGGSAKAPRRLLVFPHRRVHVPEVIVRVRVSLIGRAHVQRLGLLEIRRATRDGTVLGASSPTSSSRPSADPRSPAPENQRNAPAVSADTVRI